MPRGVTVTPCEVGTFDWECHTPIPLPPLTIAWNRCAPELAMTLSTARTTPISSTTCSARAQPLRARRAPPRAADSSADATRRGALSGAAALLLAPTWAPDARAIVSGYDKDTGGYSYAVLAHETYVGSR